MNHIDYLKSLKPEDWLKRATIKWTVKDVLSHLVGWEREVATTFLKSRESKKIPWYLETEDYDEFNEKIQKEFADWSPEDLIKEWKKWEENLNSKIREVGEDIINIRRQNLSWMVDGKENNHTDWHINQIKKALE